MYMYISTITSRLWRTGSRTGPSLLQGSPSAEREHTEAPAHCQPLLGHGHLDMASIVCRVQYLEDSDPFICTNFPEPRRPPTVSLEENVPLIEQIAGIHKLLEAPLKVGHRLGLGPGLYRPV